jgi:hypothetical protein
MPVDFLSVSFKTAQKNLRQIQEAVSCLGEKRGLLSAKRQAVTNRFGIPWDFQF